jgi:ketosteroid isomerase-like protein
VEWAAFFAAPIRPAWMIIMVSKELCMPFSREAMRDALTCWYAAWNAHDLEGVLQLMHDEVLFENWTGLKIVGKEALRKAWTPWFANHGGFRFIEEETFIDEAEEKVLFRWLLEWPCREKAHAGKWERRRGVDVMHFKDGKITHKLTYSKTITDIDGKHCAISAFVENGV